MNRRISEKWFNGLQKRERSREPLAPQGEQLLAQVKEWIKQTEQVVAAHPGTSLAVAAAAGFLIGWWTKRK